MATKPICPRCNKREVEEIDDWVSSLCGNCADIVYEKHVQRREFEHYHKDEE